ncbi:MAG TPA: hypothetical protein VN886_02525 [Acidimicrobiales bacterium]|nr:hypothetical protein [Acidimicrobiales bacterium]
MLATDAAFYVVFGIFVVAMVVLAVIIVVWAVRHDMTGWKAWRKRQETAMLAQQAHPPVQDTPPAPPRAP